jgi:hypothetical protein
MQKLLNIIKKLAERAFYGTLEVHFECGKITRIKQTENIKF